MASRRARLRKTQARITKLRSFISSTRDEFGELGLQQTSFGADLASQEILDALAVAGAPGSGGRGRKRRRVASRLLRTEAGTRFLSQLETGTAARTEDQEEIRARLKGRVTRRSLVRRIQAGRAITRRTGGLGLLGQSGSRRAAAGGV